MDIESLGNMVANVAQNSSNTSNSTASTISTVPNTSPVAQSTSVGSNPSLAQVKQAVENINNSLGVNVQNVEFTVDSESKKVVIKVIDPQTKEVIRQLPTEEVMEMSKVLGRKLGQVINQEA